MQATNAKANRPERNQSTRVDVSVVIPCYRSSEIIRSVVDRLRTTLGVHYEESQYEIILVNDYSPDDTLEVLSSIATEHANVKVISMAKNFGQHAALMAGFDYVCGDTVVCMDDDGQTRPEEIFKLLDKLDEGYDLVYAKYASKKHSAFRNFGSKINEIMAHSLIGKPKDITLSSYFAAKRFLVDEALHYKNPYPYIEGLMLRSTGSIANVEVVHSDRLAGESGYSFKGLLALWLNGFTAFSVKPLRVASVFGVVLAFFGFAGALVVVVQRLTNPDMAMGWASMFSALIFIGGLLLCMLGLLGEYIGRTYISLNNSPQYVIRDTLNCSHNDSPAHDEDAY